MEKPSYNHLSETVYHQIKEMILHLKFKPGERIPEEKLTNIVSGSRTIVRQAMHRLSDDGLVTIYPRRFSEVAYYDEPAIKQIGVLRLSQDLLACGLAIRNGSDSDFSYLQQIADKCEQGAKSGNIYERIVYDNEFHLQITKIGRNTFLIENQRKLYLRVHLIQISKYTNVEDSVAQISNHNTIIEALYKRDFSMIKESVCNHLQNFYDIDQEIVDMY